MTVDQFKEILLCNEPSFSYNGEEYSICWPDGKYYVTASDDSNALELSFDNVEDLLDNWSIQGKPLRTIISSIEIN